MKWNLVLCFVVFGVLTSPVYAAKPCNECKDLPYLFRELMEQEFLRDQFNSYVKQAYYPPTVQQMYSTVERRFNEAFYSTKGTSTGATPAAGGGGGAAFGTRSWRKECDLVEFQKGANGEQLLDKDNNPLVKPVTPQQVHAKECKAIADHVLKHEGHHQKSCKDTHKSGKTDSWHSPEFVAKDEVEAYQAGVESLRETIANLAAQCRWTGSVRMLKPDGTSVVPTKDQIEELKQNTKKTARSLKKKKVKS